MRVVLRICSLDTLTHIPPSKKSEANVYKTPTCRRQTAPDLRQVNIAYGRILGFLILMLYCSCHPRSAIRPPTSCPSSQSEPCYRYNTLEIKPQTWTPFPFPRGAVISTQEFPLHFLAGLSTAVDFRPCPLPRRRVRSLERSLFRTRRQNRESAGRLDESRGRRVAERSLSRVDGSKANRIPDGMVGIRWFETTLRAGRRQAFSVSRQRLKGRRAIPIRVGKVVEDLRTRGLPTAHTCDEWARG
ncbi:hypothetical protein BC567DRAFT_225171 [Phyllosticta citribraziliensis]